MPTRTTLLQVCSIAIATWCFSASAAAQQPDKDETQQPSWKRNFDEVDVKQINLDELPAPEESVLPSMLAAQSALPRAVSLRTLQKSAAEIAPLVVGVVVIPKSDSPMRQSTIVVQGEAIWISGKDGGTAPILITNAHYLKDAEAIFVRPTPPRKTGALPTAQRRTVNQMSLGADVEALLKDKSLVPATVEHIDKHRNLAVIAVPTDRLPAPEKGLTFFPIEEQAVASAYGFSHQMGSTLVITQFLAPKRKDYLQYYLHTSFPVILGAPIVAPDGRVIAITAMRHPADPERTLVIPPRALRKFVENVQSAIDAENAEHVENPQ